MNISALNKVSSLKPVPTNIAKHCPFEWAETFNQSFSEHKVRLQPGANEPFYQAPTNDGWAIIHSTKDYFSSTLHELAHWCVAGHERRQQDDYGYWYAPDGRTLEQQRLFYQVEVKPQALEWAFSLAANLPFRMSLDNLSNSDLGSLEQELTAFRHDIYKTLSDYFEQGFPPRALQVIQTLCQNYRAGQAIQLPRIEQCLN